jgi:hypothetical protein
VVCAGDPSAAVFELETAPLAGADFSQMTLKHLLGLKEDGLLYDQPGTLQGAVALDRTVRTVRANLISRPLVGTGKSNGGGSSVSTQPPVVNVAHLCTTAEEALKTFSAGDPSARPFASCLRRSVFFLASEFCIKLQAAGTIQTALRLKLKRRRSLRPLKRQKPTADDAASSAAAAIICCSGRSGNMLVQINVKKS